MRFLVREEDRGADWLWSGMK